MGAFNNRNKKKGGCCSMPRSSRLSQKSVTGVYHIILRGINSQEIFYDDFDKEKFIKEVKKTKEKYKYELYAYVLMSNHVHMLIKDEMDIISKAIQSLGISYAMYFNKKYERIGHLFYNRFHSKSVEDEKYLLNVHRYIHKNPLKDGISKIEEYKWSSYQDYIGNLKNQRIADTEFILNIFNEDRNKAINLWEYYHKLGIEYDYSEEREFEIKRRFNDDEAIQEIKKRLQIDNLIEIQKYNAKNRDEIIRKINLIEGITIEQLARILGISKRTIYRALGK